MNTSRIENKLQPEKSELKKITIFQIVSLVAIVIMGLIIVSFFIDSFLWRFILLALVAIVGFGLLMLFVIIPTSKLEEFLRTTVEEYNKLTRENSRLKERMVNLQGHPPQFERNEVNPESNNYQESQLLSEKPHKGVSELPITDREYESITSEAVTAATPLGCSIIQPQDGMTISNTHRILIEPTGRGAVAKVEIAFDNGEYIDITHQFDGIHYYHDCDTTELASGLHKIDARITDTSSKIPQKANAKQIMVMVDNVVRKLQINIKTDKNIYKINSALRIEVKVVDNLGDMVPDAVVDMTVYDAENSIQAAGQGATNANGVAYFGCEIMMDDPTGTYRIEAHVSKQGYESSTESITFEVERNGSI